jgi:hypothetical protein
MYLNLARNQNMHLRYYGSKPVWMCAPGFTKITNEGNMCYLTLDGHMNVLRGLPGA